MAAYIIVQANITDKEKYKEYLNKVTPIVEKYSGEYLVRGGKYEKMLGNWDYERTVVIKFPSFKLAKDFHNSSEYEPVKKIREENSIGNLIIIEGC